MTVQEVEAQLSRFLSERRIGKDFEFIVPVERKGMALVRKLGSSLSIPVESIVSSSAIDRVPPGFFRQARTLVFDDSLLSGTGMSHTVEELARKGCSDRDEGGVSTSAFLVHENCKYPVDFAYYDQLAEEDYERQRRKILTFIADSEEFLLDTEHVPLRFRCPVATEEVEGVLLNLGDLLIIPAAGGREGISLTIHRPGLIEGDGPTLLQTVTKQMVVCKLRFRLSDDCLLMAGMAYPSVPVHLDIDSCGLSSVDYSLCKLVPDFAADCLHPLGERERSKQCFLCHGFVASIGLVIQSVKRLAPHLREKGLQFDGVSVQHLRALYPTLDVDELSRVLDHRIRRALDAERKLPPLGRQVVPAGPESADYALAVELALFHHELESRPDSAVRDAPSTGSTEEGMSFRQIFESSRFLSNEAEYSRAWDVLVDRARVNPTAVLETDDTGEERWARGLRLDGESARRSVAKLYCAWSKRYLFND
jgi:hypothetical protein